MNCTEVQQLLPAYLLGALDTRQEHAAVRAHLATGCPSCHAAVAAVQNTLAQVPADLDPIAPDPATWNKILARASAPGSRGLAAAPVRRPFPLYAIAIAAGLLLAFTVALITVARTAAERAKSLELAVQDRDAQIQDLNRLAASEQLKLVSLSSTEPAGPRGRILYDPAENRWRLYVFDLKPLPNGKVYELWAITPDQKKVPAGTFTVDAAGAASYAGQVPATAVAIAAITDEPAGGSLQPTGTIHLAGQIIATR